MKTKEKMLKTKKSMVRINDSLDKYNDLPIFQEKLDKANETLKRVGMPKPELYEKNK